MSLVILKRVQLRTLFQQSFVLNLRKVHESFNDRDSEDYSDYKLFLDAKQIKHPILNELVHDHQLNVNILFSSMSDIQDETVCYMWIRFEHDEQFKRFSPEAYFSQHHIQFEEVQ